MLSKIFNTFEDCNPVAKSVVVFTDRFLNDVFDKFFFDKLNLVYCCLVRDTAIWNIY